jgi:flagellar hook-associated protein 1 FlgK
MGSILNISVTGMLSSQVGLQTVQHNVANANTAGYNRQVAKQATLDAVRTANGFVGNGTKVETVSRLYDQFLTTQVNQTQSKLAALDATTNQMEAIDHLLADPASGVAPALQDFFTASQEVGAYPSSVAARQSMVSTAQVLVNRFSTMGSTISSLNDQINQQIQTDATTLNAYAEQLVALNSQISQASSGGDSPNDLLDKRDHVVSEMGKLADIAVTNVITDTGTPGKVNEYGAIQVYTGNGHLLVGDRSAIPVSVVRSSKDPTQLAFSIGGSEIKSGDVKGGSLGGLLSFRDGILNKAENTLGQVAYSLASTFNAQHATGMDLLGNHQSTPANGNFAADFFTIPTTATTVPTPSTAPALTVNLTAPILNSDTTAGFYKTDAQKSDYKLEVLVGGNHVLTRLSDGKTWPTSPAVAADLTAINNLLAADPQGFTLDTTGTAPSVGDSYTIRPMAKMSTSLGINAQLTGDVRLIAVGLAVKANIPQANQGQMTATVTRMITGDPDTVLPTPTSTLPITYDSATGNLTGFGTNSVDVTSLNGTFTTYPQGTNIPFEAGASYNVGGIVFTMSGVPKNGDQVVLERNDVAPIGVSDSSNALLLTQMESKKVLGGSATYGEAYAQMVADVGNETATYKTTKSSQQTLYDLALSRRDSVSGVNLDEEAANLMYYQQMYQANAKALQAGQKIFDTLMSIMG